MTKQEAFKALVAATLEESSFYKDCITVDEAVEAVKIAHDTKFYEHEDGWNPTFNNAMEEAGLDRFTTLSGEPVLGTVLAEILLNNMFK